MRPETRRALADRLSRFDRLVEVGVGRRPDVADKLAGRGHDVTATDIRDCPVPADVTFARDDVTDPDPSVYTNCDVVYSLDCPPDLHRPARRLARTVDVPFLFTTLGGDPPTVPVRRETLPGETLFVATGRARVSQRT